MTDRISNTNFIHTLDCVHNKENYLPPIETETDPNNILNTLPFLIKSKKDVLLKKD